MNEVRKGASYLIVIKPPDCKPIYICISLSKVIQRTPATINNTPTQTALSDMKLTLSTRNN